VRVNDVDGFCGSQCGGWREPREATCELSRQLIEEVEATLGQLREVGLPLTSSEEIGAAAVVAAKSCTLISRSI
jgi:hypothetical protein